MLEVIESGIQTTIQELPGRVGYLNLGVYPAGPMDQVAFRAANLLVGNARDVSALEITLGGFKAAFQEPRVVAITGAAMQPTLNGAPVPMWKSFRVTAGDQLTMGTIKETGGFRAYLAVNGGFDVPKYMGSRATFTVGGFGGFHGRALKKADRLPFRAVTPSDQTGSLESRQLRSELIPCYSSEWEIEVMRGPQADPDYLKHEDMDFFFSHAWKVDRNSNRTGIRLESHKWQWARSTGGVAGGHPSNILDNGYAVWSVNICGDQPIILAADGPSLGGFICAATLIYASTWKAGQLVPGRDVVRFTEVSLEQAVNLAQQLDARISEESIEQE